MISEDEYLKAVDIVTHYLEQNKPKKNTQQWLCNKNLYMENKGCRAFTKGIIYSNIVGYVSACVIDDLNTPHTLGEWEKYFTAL